MTMPDDHGLVLETVKLMRAERGLDDEEIIERLTGTGTNRTTAAKLVAFVPSAFVMVLLGKSGARFPATFGAKAADGDWVRVQYLAEPIFRAALAMAREAYQQGVLTREDYEGAALRSAEWGAAWKLISGGGKLEAAIFGSAVVILNAEDFSEWEASAIEPRPPSGPAASLWQKLRGQRPAALPAHSVLLDPGLLTVTGLDLRAQEEVNTSLQEMFSSHDVPSTIEEGWLVFSNAPIRVNGAFFKLEDSGSSTTVQLDVRVWLQDEQRLICESFGGIGTTEEHAKRCALDGFVASTFHVLVAAFCGWQGGQVTCAEWTVGGRPMIAKVGGITWRWIEPEVPTEDAAVAWYSQLEQEIKQADIGPGTHWIRLFYSQFGNETQECEVLLDNRAWQPVQMRMRTAPWLVREEWYSARLFLILQDT